jgi:uncharacterized protein (UPF0548 family)
MLLFRQPEPDMLQRFLNEQATLTLTYQGVGTTRNQPPAGYVVDHTRAKLGTGEKVFASASAALENWQQFQLGWLEAWPATTSIRPDRVIAVVARSIGVWWLNACRIVYVIDEQKRFGFAYGTLPEYAGSGEERFLVEMDDDGTVWYDVLAFSRPHGALPHLGYPYMRYLQKQFGKQSAAVMRKIVEADVGEEATDVA